MVVGWSSIGPRRGRDSFTYQEGGAAGDGDGAAEARARQGGAVFGEAHGVC